MSKGQRAYATLRAYEVLAGIAEWFNEGDAPLHSGALLFDDERTLVEHVNEAIELIRNGGKTK